jgi:16S rRNA (cytosine967-C5)-methyltransferase
VRPARPRGRRQEGPKAEPARAGGARSVALDLLRQVLERSRPLDEALAGHVGLPGLAPRDRAFVRLLVATTLRRLGQIDTALAACLDRPLEPGPLPPAMERLRQVLRLGAAQLLFLGTPAHAAVSATVGLMGGGRKGSRSAGQRGLVNAVLRRLAREGEDLRAGQDAARLDTPDWLWESWTAAYGETATRAIAEAQLVDPPLDLSLKRPADAALWAGRLGAQRLPTGSLRLPAGSGAVAELPGYDEGAWWVQDAAAALPARLLGDVSGRQVVDLCAAPGGKTAGLAAAGAAVIAVDRAPARMSQLEANLRRLGLEADAVVADGAAWRPERPADAVLLDAPCSGTGTLRRHPDIARLKGPRDVAALTGEQDRLLGNAIEICRPGGLVVYAVCSLQPEEGPERIAALLASGAPVEREALRPEEIDGQAELIDAAGDLRTLPSHWRALGGLDGFYACRLRRR